MAIDWSSIVAQLTTDAERWISQNVHVTLSPEQEQAIIDQYVSEHLASAGHLATGLPTWAYIAGGAVLFLLLRRR